MTGAPAGTKGAPVGGVCPIRRGSPCPGGGAWGLGCPCIMGMGYPGGGCEPGITSGAEPYDPRGGGGAGTYGGGAGRACGAAGCCGTYICVLSPAGCEAASGTYISVRSDDGGPDAGSGRCGRGGTMMFASPPPGFSRERSAIQVGIIGRLDGDRYIRF